jgi:hypothetical protein
MGDFFYRPGTIRIGAGDTVTWVNVGSVREGHTVTGDGFDSGVIDAGDTYTRRFSRAGSFPYFCTLHANMRGTVQVGGGDEDDADDAGEDDEGDPAGTSGGAPPAASPSPAFGFGGALASTGANLILLAEIGIGLLALGLLVGRLRRGWPPAA